MFLLTDQWRAQATGYAGNADVKTPNLDKLAGESVNYSTAVSNCPVCCPYRASLMTSQYPLTHGVYLNDLQLNTKAVSFAQVYNQAGYKTGYIGKWHLDGSGRSEYIPPERRQGFEYWKVLECTHNYNHSEYYAGNDKTKRVWAGYDAYAQTDDALAYLDSRNKDGQPFALFVSYGSPHNPYRTGPKELQEQYDSKKIALRSNVPLDQAEKAQKELAGYYTHITAIDQCVGKLLTHLNNSDLDANTIVVFTSDHGDMLHSHGKQRKQKPWEESIRVPFLLKYPTEWNNSPKNIHVPIGTPDIMPTILGLSGLEIPESSEGEDLSKEILGQESPPDDRAALILCPSPFGEWHRGNQGREYRGIRTKRYTYVRDINGPWLLYDNKQDPFQLNNLIDVSGMDELKNNLKDKLDELLVKTGDKFLSGPELLSKCEYKVNDNETVIYSTPEGWGQVSVSCKETN